MNRLFLLATVLCAACGTTSGDLLANRDAETSARDAGSTTSDAEPSDAGPSDAGQSAPDAATVIDCAMNPIVFPDFDRACTTVNDCRQGLRQTDCCGSMLVTGFNRSEATRFAEAAALCQSQYPPCQCAPQTTVADDGTRDRGLAAAVSCDNSVCTSSFPAPIDCGGQGCDPNTEICVQRNAGGPGSAFRCESVPPACSDDRTCSCLGASICVEPWGICQDVNVNNISCYCLAC